MKEEEATNEAEAKDDEESLEEEEEKGAGMLRRSTSTHVKAANNTGNGQRGNALEAVVTVEAVDFLGDDREVEANLDGEESCEEEEEARMRINRRMHEATERESSSLNKHSAWLTCVVLVVIVEEVASDGEREEGEKTKGK